MISLSQHDASAHVFLHLPRCLPHFTERKFLVLPPFRLLPLPDPLPVPCDRVDQLSVLQSRIVHPHTQCDRCGVAPIRGICFTCYHCANAGTGHPYSRSLCQRCYPHRDECHPPSHIFLVPQPPMYPHHLTIILMGVFLYSC